MWCFRSAGRQVQRSFDYDKQLTCIDSKLTVTLMIGVGNTPWQSYEEVNVQGLCLQDL